LPDGVVKCQRCGEWLDGRSANRSDLGDAARRFVTFYIALSVLGFVLAAIVVCYLWLPMFASVRRDFHFPPP
jgi:hypothetical protein